MSAWTDFRDKIENKVSEFFTSLKAKVVALFEAGVDVVEDEIAKNKDQLGDDAIAFVKDAAAQSVAAAAAKGGTPLEKAEYALTYFLGILATKGVQFGINAAKLIIENAYADFKAKQPAAGAVIDAVTGATATTAPAQ